MLGIIVELILSWILLYFFTKKNLLALGLTPFRSRLNQFVIGFIFTGVMCSLIQILDSTLTNIHWKLNPTFSFAGFFNSIWWNVKSVVFEELIFRGAILYIAIRKLGANIGILLSAISFGIYHWFSFGVLGNVVSMSIVFIMTSITGFVWAYAFLKSESMALPIGFHLGWNFTYNSIFSKGPLGEQILLPMKGTDSISLISEVNFLINFLLPNIAVPLLTFMFIRFYISKFSKEKLN
ncbi:CPBP family intramembrane glutamic endopeptidase [Ammoniphilus sp. CFH 90114]|uniref:CPBP family intramembrane glutamic endopeptidase n=1 Tax=Ammoniphilus sp. CFH 90114 TaxID=2493665 RepID=UPI00100E7F60|nr:CPBP family intramembrane glutamic endopeptidase [Ammoniphilus sp. CFH 90114]RXT03919.1 CPBP family intramembrane metalloprotease [Ammoniphilus sp. CFH 90114]